MQRNSIVAYALVTATLGFAIVMKAASRDRTLPREIPADNPASDRRTLSAIILPDAPPSRDAQHLADLRQRIGRLRIQRDSLEQALTAGRPGRDLIEVDLKTLCRSSDLIHASLATPNLAKSKLAEILALSDTEVASLTELIDRFRVQLHQLERHSITELPETSETSTSPEGRFVIQIPARVAGRDQLFQDLDQGIGELLGSPRGQAVYTWLSYNTAIGEMGGSKEYSFVKSADGSVEVSADLRTQIEYFPGTEIVYDGTPGIEPDVTSTRHSHSTSTLQADEAEAIFGNLIDLDRLPIAEEN